MLGYVIGAIAGGALGFALGFRPRLARIVEPYILIFSAIPKIAIAPIIIIALGIGTQSKVAIVVSMVFFLMFYAVFSGVKQIEPDFIHQARIMGANRARGHRLHRHSGDRAEHIRRLEDQHHLRGDRRAHWRVHRRQGGTWDIYILNASGAFNINGIWVGVILIVALVFVLTTAIGIAERRVLRWLPDLGSGRGGIWRVRMVESTRTLADRINMGGFDETETTPVAGAAHGRDARSTCRHGRRAAPG